MFIEIKETEGEKRITCIDPKTNIDWSGDLIGNTNPENEGYNDDGIMIMTQDNFDWWENYCEKYENADYAVYEFLNDMEEKKECHDDYQIRELYNDFINGVEFNDYPAAMLQFIEENK